MSFAAKIGEILKSWTIAMAKEILWMQVGEILKSLTRHDPAPKFNWWILKGGTLRCFTGSFPCPSLSQDMGGSPNCGSESGMSLVMSSVWRSYSEPAAADVWTPSIWTSFAFLLIFLNTRFLSAWIVWIGISTAWLDEPWAVTDPWSFRKWRSK